MHYKGKWNEVFGNDHPLHLEIGTGKGQFISQMARKNPEINFIGIEQQESVIVTAIDKAKEAQVNNLRLININAEQLLNIFSEKEIDTIYLNFSDPWPKKNMRNVV